MFTIGVPMCTSTLHFRKKLQTQSKSSELIAVQHMYSTQITTLHKFIVIVEILQRQDLVEFSILTYALCKIIHNYMFW